MKAVFVARIAATALLLFLLFLWLPTDELREAWPDSAASATAWLVAGLLLTIASLVVAALRWRHVVAQLGFPLRWRRAVWYTLAGEFASNFLPSTIGGDALRVSRLGQLKASRTRAFASVVIDRLTGWVVLPTLIVLGLLAYPSLVSEPAGATLGVIAGVVALMLIAVLYAAEHPKGLGRLRRTNTISRALGAVHDGIVVYRRSPLAALKLIGIGVAFQVLAVAGFACVGTAFDVRPGLAAWLAIVPAVLVIQVLPITIGGLGTREWALAFFLAPHGVDSAEAVLVGLAAYGVTVLASMAGAPALAVRGERRAADAQPTQMAIQPADTPSADSQPTDDPSVGNLTS